MNKATPTRRAPGRQRYIGVIAPYDFALDRELWKWTPTRANLLLTRTAQLGLPSTVEMAEGVSDANTLASGTRALLTTDPDVVLYLCTSGSFVRGVDGERAMRETMIAAGARAAVTTSGALVEATSALGVRRLAVATPYLDNVTAKLHEFLHEAGLDVVGGAGLGIDERIWEVDAATVRRLVFDADRPDADAVFVSCTNLRTYGLIRRFESELGKPVLTANQVSVWAALRAAGLEPPTSKQWLFAAAREGHERLATVSALPAGVGDGVAHAGDSGQRTA
ncbi:Asp/Glu/hydantoin racemase [Rhodococcus sp. HNM0569]|uniref:maleate cis-trans isomerase family protein n=1 Tax=Rhodococcus sp. HNM0569 TaxID=2716340 RepID=UPI00146B793B|nr:Asp/Glu/hydantoin racemase [Rhodococcus sp. HNM0569]NLU84396.1 Asp/Glu/hydantoin racemase [Rhodococcus sp. HNM0569]